MKFIYLIIYNDEWIRLFYINNNNNNNNNNIIVIILAPKLSDRLETMMKGLM